MKALIFDGSEKENKTLSITREIAEQELAADRYTFESLVLRQIQVAPCLGCFGCWVKTPGTCVINDPIGDISKKAFQSDILVFVTPIIFGGYSTEIKKILDRWISIVLPFFTRVGNEVRHPRRYRKHPALIFIGMLNAPDFEKEGIFRSLAKCTAMNSRASAYVCKVILQEEKECMIRKIFKESLREIQK